MADDFEVGAPLPEESSNRTFVLAAAGLGGLLILSMICLGIYALVIAPRQEEARIARATEIVQENTQTALSLTQTVEAERATATPAATDTQAPTATPTVTPTQVVVLPSDTPTAIPETQTALTATAAAQATLDAEQQAETPTATPTALPSTGVADEAGLPGLLMAAAALVVVVFLARRMRSTEP
jgi:apolipoprotein N-acyltransferase